MPSFSRALQERIPFLSALVFLCVLFGLTLPACAAPFDAAIKKAHEMNLANERYWQILLHYKSSWTSSTASLIDDPNFFVSPKGKTNPSAELEATLSGLYQSENEKKPNAHIRCRFPARSEWLIKTLELDTAALPEIACRDLNETLSHVQPQSAVLIFPGNHNNSPASMFGHTLLSIQGKRQSRLLSYAVNYSARTNETNGFAFAFKGIFGLYPGYYSLLPYYAKIREYNDLERRDIWEYDLNLTPRETRLMALHIWELKDIYSDYYFFDENCSYNLLFLLESARPSLDLTTPCRPWVIPIDTVRIISKADLVEQVTYRPSKASRILHIAQQMSGNEVQAAHSLLAGESTPREIITGNINRQGKIRILNVASETLEFRYYRGELTKEDYRRRSLELLSSRSELGIKEEKKIQLNGMDRPDNGHGSNRLALGLAYTVKKWEQELRLRPAYHNLLDDDQGYLPGSQIDFLNLVLRRTAEGNVRVSHFNLIDIVSLTPRHPFYKPKSWSVKTGLIRRKLQNATPLQYQLQIGGGLAWGSSKIISFVLSEIELLAHNEFHDSLNVGIGASTGLLLQIHPRWKALLRGRSLYFEDPNQKYYTDLTLQQNFRLTANWSFVIEATQNKQAHQHQSTISTLINHYW